METAGRFSDDAMDFRVQLREARARSLPACLHKPAQYAFHRRWSRLMAVTAATAYAASILEDKSVLARLVGTDGSLAWIPDLLAEARHDEQAVQAAFLCKRMRDERFSNQETA